MNIELYKAVNDLRFQSKDGSTFTLHGGQYGTGNGALYVRDSDGSAECNLTVNMVDAQDQLATDEFFVRLETIKFSVAPKVLLDLGLFAKTGRVIDAGFATPYAEIWRFADCLHGPGKAIACAKCRASR